MFIELFLGFLIIVLVVVLGIEIRGYEKFTEQIKNVNLLTDILQASIVDVGGAADRLSKDQLLVRQDLDVVEKELALIRAVISVHSEALNVGQLSSLLDKLTTK